MAPPRFLSTNQSIERAGDNSATVSASGPSKNLTGSWWSEAEASLFTQWASAFNNYNDSFNNPYFDYFYTGQDIQVTIDGLNEEEDLLPFYSFAYNIQQQKQPIYGYWSYTYDAMLRGTRLITGAFSIVSMSPYMLTQKIAKAADIRAKSTEAQRVQSNLHAIRGLDEDEALVNTYWRKNFDSNLFTGQQHLFSVHPPFNLVLRYGLQEASVVADNPAAIGHRAGIRNTSGNSQMTSDFNERLVKNPVDALDTQILLENVEIISKQIEFDTEGNPLLETYTFMARDEVLLQPTPSSSLTVYAPNPNVAAPSNTVLSPIIGRS